MKSSGSSEQLDADGDTGSEVSSEVSFSYEFAQTEVLMKALGSNGEGAETVEGKAVSGKNRLESWTFVSPDPMQAVLQSLERQHEEEKRSALERQRQMYELELQQLRKKLHPERLSTGLVGQPLTGHPGPGQQSHYRSMERLSVGGMSQSSNAQSRLRQWTEDRWDGWCVACMC